MRTNLHFPVKLSFHAFQFRQQGFYLAPQLRGFRPQRLPVDGQRNVQLIQQPVGFLDPVQFVGVFLPVFFFRAFEEDTVVLVLDGVELFQCSDCVKDRVNVPDSLFFCLTDSIYLPDFFAGIVEQIGEIIDRTNIMLLQESEEKSLFLEII